MNLHDTKEIKALLGLVGIKGLGPSRIRTLINVFGRASAVKTVSLQRLQSVPGIDHEIARRIKEAPMDEFIHRQYELMDRFRVTMIPFWDHAYPGLLKKIYDPPVMLFCRGDKRVLKNDMFAVVGTRKPTAYGRNITEKLTSELMSRGFQIVSGLASGVDTIAHQTVLRHRGITVGVLGSGLDWIYPAANRRLALDILHNGALLSEYPMGTHPDPANFPRRNRIVSGLSRGVLVTEAGLGSGALITAYLALDQNREVFAVPGPVFSDLSSGVHKLIQEGAKLVHTVDDILTEIDASFVLPPTAMADLPELSEGEKGVYEILTGEPMHIDAIVQKGQRTAAESLATLLALEIKGLVRQMAGKMFVRI